MKTQSTSKQVLTQPCKFEKGDLITCHTGSGIVILCSGANTLNNFGGIVVHPGNTKLPIGDSNDENFLKSAAKPFFGTVEISNI